MTSFFFAHMAFSGLSAPFSNSNSDSAVNRAKRGNALVLIICYDGSQIRTPSLSRCRCDPCAVSLFLGLSAAAEDGAGAAFTIFRSEWRASCQSPIRLCWGDSTYLYTPALSQAPHHYYCHLSTLACSRAGLQTCDFFVFFTVSIDRSFFVLSIFIFSSMG